MKKKDNIEENIADSSSVDIPLTSDNSVDPKDEIIANKDKEIEELKKKNTELEDKVKYTSAELVNYRKRKDEETSNLLKFANQDLIVDLIPILDNFERALKFDEDKLDDNQKKFLQGFKMLFKNYNDVLKKYGVEEIETLDKDFDPMLHEAMMVGKDETKPNERILECLLKGYTLKGKVIRPAKVSVNNLDE